MTMVQPRLNAAIPLPPGRGLWRITLHTRAFASGVRPENSGIGEVVDARSRRLEQAWNQPAKLTFTLNGRSQAAAQIRELQHDVIAWRWGGDVGVGRDLMMFRGLVTMSEDQLTEQAHTVNFTCYDYLAMLGRRYVTAATGVTYTNQDQDTIVGFLLNLASGGAQSGSGTSFSPGSYLPLQVLTFNPDGTGRPNSGQLRTRQYFGGQEIGAAVHDLALVINGFDYDAWPTSDGSNIDGNYGGGVDTLRIFYPSQGTTRTDMALIYGSTVSAVTRTINPSGGAYANYARVLGNNANSDPTAAQLYGESWNPDSNNIGQNPVGLWAVTDNPADVNQQNTLTQKAQGMVGLPDGSSSGINGVLVPSYSVTMRPGAYRRGSPRMGDTVPLIIQSGRLNVNTTVRVLGIDYAIGDDGQEDISLTVGRPAVTLASLLTQAGRDINALARR